MTLPWQVTTLVPNGHCGYCGTAYAPDAPWPRVCSGCGETTWRNPLPVGLVLVPVAFEDGRGPGLIVVRRDIEPARGQLCLPGGFIEFGESWEQGAARELREETGLHADPAEISLFDVLSTGAHVLVFGIVPPRPAASLPMSAPTDESTEWTVLEEAVEVAFPLHTIAIAKFFAGGTGPARRASDRA
jgi:ADP-ribose pyrophosphatase YjhB (NUDIX family)